MNRAQDLNITVMWSLFSGGRTFYGYQAARARADAATLMRAGTELDVATQSRLDYITAVRERENARVTGDLLRQTEERLRVTREEFDAGRVPKLNVLRDEAEFANVIQMDTMARNRAELALINLKTTLGVDLASPLTLGEELEYQRVAVSVSEATTQALAAHPEVLSAERQARAAEMEKRAAYGRYFPELQATWMYDWQRMWNRGDEMAETPEGYSAGLVLTVPLFDGFMRENAIGTGPRPAGESAGTAGVGRPADREGGQPGGAVARRRREEHRCRPARPEPGGRTVPRRAGALRQRARDPARDPRRAGHPDALQVQYCCRPGGA